MDNKKIGFDDLPPRVVIFDILSYHLFVFYPNVGSFDLFGYFKKDRSRHIWFLFTSIQIEEENITEARQKTIDISENRVFINLSKISSLSLLNSSLESIRSFETQICHMVNLERISLKDDRYSSIMEEVGKKWVELLPKMSILSKLRSVDIDTNFSNLMGKSNGLKLSKPPFTNLDRLYFSMPIVRSPFNDFFQQQQLKSGGEECLINSNLKRIYFEYIHISRETRVKFPNLQRIWLNNCSNLIVEPGNELTHVNLLLMKSKLIEEIYRRCTKVKYLTYSEKKINLFDDDDDDNDDENLDFSHCILKREYNPLYKLKNLKLRNVDVDTRLENDIFRLRNRLKTLEFSNMNGLREDVFLSEFPKLKTLRIKLNWAIEGVMGTWPLCKTLKNLTCFGLYKLKDYFFQKNEFEDLENLKIHNCDLLIGSQWNNFPKIKSISFSLCRMLDDSFFQDQKFPKKTLEKIHIEACYEVLGKGWGKKKKKEKKSSEYEEEEEEEEENESRCLNIIKLTIHACFDMQDHLFQEISFPKLETLWLDKVHKMKGIGWKKIPKLRKVISSRNGSELQEKFEKMKEESRILLKEVDDKLDF